MANQLGLLHPRMLDSLPRFYPDTCTLQTATLVNTAGKVTYSYSNAAGMVDIPCRVAPVAQQSEEVSTPEQAFWVDWVRIALAGNYDALPNMRAVVGVTNYDVRLVEHDGNSRTTYLMCRAVT